MAGASLARGYVNQPDLTAERFIPNPFSTVPGERLYRTGDRARYLANGEIEFMGRQDHQIKIRGHRIELGEIEAVINQYPAVADRIVVGHEAERGEKRLVAYLVPIEPAELSLDRLRTFLLERVPEYMAPGAFVVLEALPLTPNGKLDRRALPAPDLRPAVRRGPRNAAEEMIFGFVILNDWSARDIQQWEYVPLGPFQAKAFATSISPWVVTREALEPFRLHGPAQDPVPLPYLRQTQPNNFDLDFDVSLRASGMNEAKTICRTNFKYMYWSSVQQLVHHASSGCAMNVGDLLGSGTISGPEKHQRGSLLEISWNGSEPVELASGVTRSFLEDGDSLLMRGWCQGDGYRVGFGAVEGTILPAE